MTRLSKTRKSALSLGRVYYKTGKPCKRGHISQRFTKTGRCVECNKVNTIERRVSIKQRTPPWVDVNEILAIYEKAGMMGSEFVVDHDIPLNGETVSGLHCPENLVIIDAIANMRKGNSFDNTRSNG